MVSRLTGQKGFSFLIPALEEILKEDLQFVLLGDGEPGIAGALEKISKSGANNFSFQLGYDNRLAHLIEAGSDLYLMPSLYEPCGLNQIYSQLSAAGIRVRSMRNKSNRLEQLFINLVGQSPVRANGK